MSRTEYITEVVSALEYIRNTLVLQQEEKRRFFRSANRNLGSSALCLSGGASFGYCTFPPIITNMLIANQRTDHIGVVRALLDAELLPRVVAGTSAGGLVAALVCTRSDDELKQLLVPELADMMYSILPVCPRTTLTNYIALLVKNH